MSIQEQNDKLLERLSEAIGKENVLESKHPKEKKAYVRITVDKLRDAVSYLKDKEGFYHLATMTAIDLGEEREINYHLDKPGILLTLRVRIPADKPVVPSIYSIINGAVLYEREMHDLIGVVAEGHPEALKRLHMSDDWPEGVYPLLKKYDIKSLRKIVDGEEWT